MRKPTLDALRMFDASARHLNFRLASEELNLTQGAVAQRVRKLEEELGCKLFERKARGLSLTEAGAAYHPAVRQAFQLIDAATENLHPGAAQVTLSVPPSLASKWLVPRMPDFHERYPGIDLRVIASEQIAQFGSDGVDLAIRVGPRPMDRRLSADLLTPVDLKAVCSPGLADELGPFKDLTAFTDLPLIQDGHCHWERLFRAAGLKAPEKLTQFNQTGLAMDAAANGQGIALAPSLFVGNSPKAQGLRIVWSPPDGTQDGFYLVHPRDRARPSQTYVRAWILEQVLAVG